MGTNGALSLLHCNALEEVIRRSPNVGQRNERAKIGQTNESSEVTCVEGQMYHKNYSSLRQLYIFELQLSDFQRAQAKKNSQGPNTRKHKSHSNTMQRENMQSWTKFLPR